MIGSSQLLPALTAPGWRDIPGLEHGFFTRRGGIGTGPFAELNFSRRVGDTAEAVGENWARARAHVDHRLEFLPMNQVHGARVVEIPSPATDPGDADAMITTVSRVGLCVLTADCVPILLVAPRARLVGVVHAGWRGTVAGVTRAAVTRLLEISDTQPGEIRAALGPAIGPCCYEVDASIAEEIEARWGLMPAVRRYLRNGTPKARLDLRAVNVKQLTLAGLNSAAIATVGDCTCCNSVSHFSHRAATSHQGAGVTGRQLSFIGWSS